jgi:hypothetical protein
MIDWFSIVILTSFVPFRFVSFFRFSDIESTMFLLAVKRRNRKKKKLNLRCCLLLLCSSNQQSKSQPVQQQCTHKHSNTPHYECMNAFIKMIVVSHIRIHRIHHHERRNEFSFCSHQHHHRHSTTHQTFFFFLSAQRILNLHCDKKCQPCQTIHHCV